MDDLNIFPFSPAYSRADKSRLKDKDTTRKKKCRRPVKNSWILVFFSTNFISFPLKLLARWDICVEMLLNAAMNNSKLWYLIFVLFFLSSASLTRCHIFYLISHISWHILTLRDSLSKKKRNFSTLYQSNSETWHGRENLNTQQQ